ncbi:MAG TPA: PilZ domain-containing protein [Vicinamibacterales bacterium]|nr:PilZ domain-containing protein [Vicinamibacterales bacterium]
MSSIVVIGPSEALPVLRERLDSGVELHTFTDAEALEALDHIIRTKPRIVALETDFSSTSRGTALINRIKDDPSLTGCEVRVVAHDTALNRVAVRRSSGRVMAAVVAVEEPQKPLDQRGTRRATRVRVREGVEVLVDGNAAALIDISAVGLQVLSQKMLKPNQRVRLSLPEGKTAIRCSGSIAWASFEMPTGLPPRYRAGIELTNTDPVAVNGYADKHRRK